MKTSQYIQFPDACAFIEAAYTSYYLEKPWNCFITINLQSAGIAPKDISLHHRRSINRIRKFHQRNGMNFSCGWVIENSEIVGTHVHLMVHRPHQLPMHPMNYYWAVIKQFQIKRTKGIIQVRKFWNHQSYEMNLTKLSIYCLKGLRLGTEEEFQKRTNIKISKTRKSQGLIYGKRIGHSIK